MSGHPHIVELREIFLTQQHLAIVTEYVDGETLEVSHASAQQLLVPCTTNTLWQSAS